MLSLLAKQPGERQIQPTDYRTFAMKSDSKIVAGGGWITRTSVGRPKARLFTILSIAWLLVSVPASMPLFVGLSLDPLSELQLVCGLLVIPQPVFIVLAVIYRLTERPRTVTERIPNPDYNPRNLY